MLDRQSWIRVAASPLWIKRDWTLLASFGGELPYRDVVLIAAYPMSALSTGSDFIIYRRWSTPLEAVFFRSLLRPWPHAIWTGTRCSEVSTALQCECSLRNSGSQLKRASQWDQTTGSGVKVLAPSRRFYSSNRR